MIDEPQWWGAAMKFQRRRFLHLAAGAATMPAMSRIARAQAYPVRPAEFGQLIAGETDKWAKVVKFSGAKAN
jgi:hypothetical protein